MLQQNTTKRLGYWLLLLHQLFEEDMGASLREDDLDRRKWQVLHALAIGLTSQNEIDTAFAPFLVVDRELDYSSIVDDFVGRGWAKIEGEVISLTPAGVEAHTRAETVVNEQAVGILKGITEEEFLAANDVLRRISLNMADG
jgi:hypothetical protein